MPRASCECLKRTGWVCSEHLISSCRDFHRQSLCPVHKMRWTFPLPPRAVRPGTLRLISQEQGPSSRLGSAVLPTVLPAGLQSPGLGVSLHLSPVLQGQVCVQGWLTGAPRQLRPVLERAGCVQVSHLAFSARHGHHQGLSQGLFLLLLEVRWAGPLPSLGREDRARLWAGLCFPPTYGVGQVPTGFIL